jgi:hypothetical protein
MSSRSRRLERATSARKQGGAPIRALLPGALAAALIVGTGLWFLAGRGDDGAPATPDPQVAASSQGSVPEFVSLAPDRVRQAYDFAATHGAQLSYIPCYCGCGGHSGHRNVRDCFIKNRSASNITYEEHGSQCDVCVSIVLDAKEMLARGDTLAMVRVAIDQEYADVGPGTDTPLPPGMED